MGVLEPWQPASDDVVHDTACTVGVKCRAHVRTRTQQTCIRTNNYNLIAKGLASTVFSLVPASLTSPCSCTRPTECSLHVSVYARMRPHAPSLSPTRQSARAALITLTHVLVLGTVYSAEHSDTSDPLLCYLPLTSNSPTSSPASPNSSTSF